MPDWSPETDTQPFVPVAPEPEPGPGLAQSSALGSAGVAADAPGSSSSTAPTAPVSAGPIQAGTSRLPRGGAGWVNVALAVAIAVAIGGIGFAAGRLTAPASAVGAGASRTFGGGQLPGQGAGQAPNGVPGGGTFRGDDGFGDGLRGVLGAGGLSVQGTVQSLSGGVLTLQLASGQTIQISLGSNTTYHSEATAAAGDVKTGGTVIVRLQVTRGQGTGATSPTATDVTIVP